MALIDTFFFLVFGIVSLIWWIPAILLLFAPFFLARKVKRKIEKIATKIEIISERKLRQFKTLKKMIKLGRKAERQSKKFYNSLANKAYQKTVWWQRMEIIEAVSHEAKVLDIGCGNGYLAKLLVENKNARVTCVDVDDFNQTEIPTILFDGVNLPFPNKEFDVVILSYVLHHSEFQGELLSEAARVCRGEIIIYEDETIVGGEELFAAAHTKIWNFIADREEKVTYHPPTEWREIFSQNNLEIVEEKREWGIGSLAIPLKKAIFVLKTKN